MSPRTQICLLIGTPRGFTRSVLEGLLKRGSRVILACPDQSLGLAEHKRLSGLYGHAQISLSLVKPAHARSLESIFVRALDTHGGVTCIINSTADDKLQVTESELRGSRDYVEKYLNFKQQRHDVDSIKRISRLAVKYLGKQNGFQGGNLLNLSSSTELFHQTTNIQSPASNTPKPSSVSRCEEGAETCSVLGTTRGLGVAKNVDVHGVKMFTVYQPSIDYPELSVAAQITDDEHSPYYQWNRYNAYCREYTGYMALHVADTASPGTAWRFNSELRLEQVQPEMLPSRCRVANKMCYWLGCPHVPELVGDQVVQVGQGVQVDIPAQGEPLPSHIGFPNLAQPMEQLTELGEE